MDDLGWRVQNWHGVLSLPVNLFRSMLICNASEELKTDKGATMSSLPMYRRMRPSNIRGEFSVVMDTPDASRDVIEVRVFLPGNLAVNELLSRKFRGTDFQMNKEKYINMMRNFAMKFLESEDPNYGIECTEVCQGDSYVKVTLTERYGEGLTETYMYPKHTGFKRAKEQSMFKFRRRQERSEIHDKVIDRAANGFTEPVMTCEKRCVGPFDQHLGTIRGCAYNLIVKFEPRQNTSGVAVGMALSFSEEMMHALPEEKISSMIQEKVIKLSQEVTERFLKDNMLGGLV